MHMNTFDADRVTRRGLATALVVAPVLWLASGLICPPLKSDAAKQLTVVAAHPDRWYWFTLLLVAGTVLMVPALLATMRLLRTRSPKLALIGGWLALFGVIVAIGDGASQFATWVMVRPGHDPTQMARLLDDVSKSSGANILYTLGGPTLLIGILLLSIGIYRSRIAPHWVPVTFFLSTVVNIVAFSNAMTLGVTASYVLLVPPTVYLARLVLRDEAVTDVSYVDARRLSGAARA